MNFATTSNDRDDINNTTYNEQRDVDMMKGKRLDVDDTRSDERVSEDPTDGRSNDATEGGSDYAKDGNIQVNASETSSDERINVVTALRR